LNPGGIHLEAIFGFKRATSFSKYLRKCDGVSSGTLFPERVALFTGIYSPEIPGANGQGKTKKECLKSLSEAIKLILEDRREDAIRGIPKDAVSDIVAVE